MQEKRPWSATGRCRLRVAGREGQPAATAREAPVVPAEVADEIEVRSQARLVQHSPGVAADREYPPGVDPMVLVQDVPLLVAGDIPPVDHRLAVVLARRLQSL